MIAQDKPTLLYILEINQRRRILSVHESIDTIEGFKIPLIFILGNHDINNQGSPAFYTYLVREFYLILTNTGLFL